MASPRVRFTPVEGAAKLFSPDFNDYLVALHDGLGARIHDLLASRAAMLKAAHAGRRPGPRPPSVATTGDWRVPPVPDELRTPGIEISGPCSITTISTPRRRWPYWPSATAGPVRR